MSFGNRPVEKIAVFVDGANISATSQMLGMGFRIDFKKLLGILQSNHTYLVGAYYYTAVDEDPEGNQRLRPLIDWLSQDGGYTVVEKPAKRYNKAGVDVIKGNMDVEMTLDVIHLCEHVDRVILVSGDGDFTALVKAVQAKGRRVTVVSTPGMLADILKKAANNLVDLAKHREAIAMTTLP